MRENSIVYRELRPTASKPPNAPDTVAAEKKIAARMPNSERLYQLHDVFVSEYRMILCVTYHDK